MVTLPKRQTFFTRDARYSIGAAGAKLQRVRGEGAVKFDVASIDNGQMTIAGYALVWNVLSSDRGGYKVRLLPASARFAIPTHALWHHEYRDVLGSTASNTLRITPDDYGVRVEIDLPRTSAGRDVAELVSRGDVGGMSFSMIEAETSEVTENGETIVEAKSYLVDEVTVTAIPAFTQTDVWVQPGADVAPSPAGYSATRAARRRFEHFRLSAR